MHNERVKAKLQILKQVVWRLALDLVHLLEHEARIIAAEIRPTQIDVTVAFVAVAQEVQAIICQFCFLGGP